MKSLLLIASAFLAGFALCCTVTALSPAKLDDPIELRNRGGGKGWKFEPSLN